MSDDRMKTQGDEFDAMAKLAERWRPLSMTAVVDDDYPEMRHGWESALADFCDAMRRNGRDPSTGRPVRRMVNVDEAGKITPVAGTLNALAAELHEANATWWTAADGSRLERNKGELLCLIHSEISECMEGERKNLMDTHLPHRKMAEVELADVLIRVFDYAGAYGYDLDGALAEKRAYNARREDHKRESRDRADGKKW